MEALTFQSTEKEWVIKIDRTQSGSKEISLELAILLYQREIISLGKAASLAGLHRLQFQAELDKRKIDIHYSIQEFERDLLNLKAGLQ